ncbi:MAG: aminotransferase class V-fold PLP-dependent enzyme [Alphaproteobacteria bacterium]|nr:aminotransferase class V-fold PLP-dependent enzyme [Alphaproteobacteria bacterium]
MLPCQRHLFEIPEDVAYFNCAYVSPLMASVSAAGARGIARKVRPWELETIDFFTEADAARAAFAPLIGASADDIAIVPAASYGIALAANNLPLAPGRRIVVLAEQHPSNVLVWRERARATGAELLAIPRPGDGNWTGAVLGALDERTAIAALPQCHWTDGGLLDLEPIGARCRAVGAALVLDLTQSCGALPFDVARVRPDFAVSACYKWLLGPYTLGFLYAAPHRQAGAPIENSHFQRLQDRSFGGPVTYPEAFEPGARRYDMGERANFTAMPMAIAAFEQIRAWGLANIAETLAAHTRAIADHARSFGLAVPPDPHRAPHFLGIRFPAGLPAELPARLRAAKVFVSVRGGDSLRISPHVWISSGDIARLLDALSAAA